jgi:excisionase family DNA binding protein
MEAELVDREKLLLTTREAARALGIGRSKFFALLKDGHFDKRKIGSKTVVTVASVRAFADRLPKSVV